MASSRRGFLTGLAVASASRLFAADTERRRTELTILHTNDIHGHLSGWQGWEGELRGRRIGGLDRLATAIGEARRERGDRVLLVDAGDLWGDTMIADLTRGRALVEAMERMGYDAMTVGNHEPDFGPETLAQHVREMRFPVVAANLVADDGRPLTRPYVIRPVGGVRVGILGLAYPKTAWTSSAKNVEGLEFQDPVEPTQKYLAEMRQEGAELALILSHLGLSGDKHLAEAVEGIDVIVGGHSHNRMTEALHVGRTLIVQAGAHGSDLGRLDLVVESGRVVDHRRQLVTLDHERFPAEKAMARFIETAEAPHRTALDEIVGHAATWLVRAQTLAGQEARRRDEQSPIDSLMADILRAETGAEVAFLPGVGYGVGIPPGPVTAAMLRQLVPHDGKVVTMRLSGSQILAILEQAIENTFSEDPRAKVGGMIQVSGIRFTYDPVQPAGRRVIRVERTEGPWSAESVYHVATNSMLADGGHRYAAFPEGRNRAERGSQFETVKAHCRARSPVVAPEAGRIVRVS